MKVPCLRETYPSVVHQACLVHCRGFSQHLVSQHGCYVVGVNSHGYFDLFVPDRIWRTWNQMPRQWAWKHPNQCGEWHVLGSHCAAYQWLDQRVGRRLHKFLHLQPHNLMSEEKENEHRHIATPPYQRHLKKYEKCFIKARFLILLVCSTGFTCQPNLHYRLLVLSKYLLCLCISLGLEKFDVICNMEKIKELILKTDLKNQEKKRQFKHYQMENMPKFTEKYRKLVIVRIAQNLQNFANKFGIKQITLNCIIFMKN